MSLGLMGISTKHIRVLIDPIGKACMDKQSPNNYIHSIVSFIVFHVIHEDLSVLMPIKSDQPSPGVICRTAYAFQHPLWLTNGYGFKCCSYLRSKRTIFCDMETGEYWYVFWLGPLVLLIWVYLAIVLHLIKTYRAIRIKRKARVAKLASAKISAAKETVMKMTLAKSAQERMQIAKDGEQKFLMATTSISAMHSGKASAQKLSKINLSAAIESADNAEMLKNTVDKMEKDFEQKLNKAVSVVGSEMAKKLAKPSDMMAMDEKCTIFDIIGFPKPLIAFAKQLLKASAEFGVFVGFYYVHIVMILNYADISLIPYMYSSGEVYLNIFGHLGWLFAPMSTHIFKYAIVEAVILFLLPLFGFYLYASLKLKLPTAVLHKPKTMPKVGLIDSVKRLYKTSEKLLSFGSQSNYGSNAQTSDDTEVDLTDLKPVFLDDLERGFRGKLVRFVNSRSGRVLQIISGVVVTVYVIFIGGPDNSLSHLLCLDGPL